MICMCIQIEVMTSSQCATTVHAIRDSELACLPAGLLDTIKLKQPQVRDGGQRGGRGEGGERKGRGEKMYIFIMCIGYNIMVLVY